jgi:hypothetical protein
VKIDIIGILDRGTPNLERLHLRVRIPVSLHYYAIFVTNYVTSSSIASTPRNAYWFPAQQVYPGHDVVLYTGKGVNKSEALVTAQTHFFYWGLDATVWNRPEDCAVLVELSNWQTTLYWPPPPPLPPLPPGLR